nr:MAG TPA: hypothetical protein [Caudoviricetes sp.]
MSYFPSTVNNICISLSMPTSTIYNYILGGFTVYPGRKTRMTCAKICISSDFLT